jgi:serine/threonine-protein kinase
MVSAGSNSCVVSSRSARDCGFAASNILNITLREDRGCAYIVMEYVEGGPLTRRMTGEPLSAHEALSLVIPIGDALAYAHSQKIIHQDIRPSNVLLIRPDWPLLMDFGLAKVVASHPRDTITGTISMGLYLAPEQLTGQEVDQRADITVMGLVLYELLTGKLPFQPLSAAPTDKVMLRLHDAPTPPSALYPTLAGTLDCCCSRRYPAIRGCGTPRWKRLSATCGSS